LARCSAFTIIEIVVATGIVLVLVGLLAPVVAASRESSVQARRLAHVRTLGMAVAGYAEDQRDRYPAMGLHVGDGMLEWFRPMIAIGQFASEGEIDAEGLGACGSVTYALSGCVLAEPAVMRRGLTLPIDLTPVRGARQADVAFAADKGLLVKWLHVEDGRHVFWTYEPWLAPRSPVAMADGSAVTARCTDFVRPADAYLEHWVGSPVLSTWDGLLGRDR